MDEISPRSERGRKARYRWKEPTVRMREGGKRGRARIGVHVGVFAIKLTRKQRLCQRHRAPLDRYIFISISRMFLKPYSAEERPIWDTYFTMTFSRTRWKTRGQRGIELIETSQYAPLARKPIARTSKKERGKIDERARDWERVKINNRPRRLSRNRIDLAARYIFVTSFALQIFLVHDSSQTL